VSESAGAKFPGEKIGGLRRLAFGLAPTGEVVFPDDAAMDVLVAIVEDEAERNALAKKLSALGKEPPAILVAPARDEALERISEAWTARVEATALDPQGLIVLRRDPLGEPAVDIVYDAPFELVVPFEVETRGLAAIALHVSGEGLGPDDELDLAFVGGAQNQTLGAWRVPARAISGCADWLTLDFAASLTQLPQTAFLVVRGRVDAGGVIRFSRAACEEKRPAARVYAARELRLAASPFWVWPGADGRPIVPASSLNGACWLGARLLGEAAELPPQSGEKRLRVEAGRSALLVFSDVDLAESAAVTARVSGEGAEAIEVRLALIQANRELGDDPEQAQEAAFAWSTSQIVKDDDATLSVVLPADAPSFAHLALSFRHPGAQGASAAILLCQNVWLAPRRLRKPAKPAARRSDAKFEGVRLDGVFANETYRHIDVSIQVVSMNGRMWPVVKFKVFEERGEIGFEFRSGAGFPTFFSIWPGTESDAYGSFFKVVGASQFEHVRAGFAKENDRLLLAAIKEVLPSVVNKLGETGQLDRDSAKSWLVRVESFAASGPRP
jgi:hypothetical protein